MGTTTITNVLVHEQCCKCGVSFGMTQRFHDKRRQDGGEFYCPGGHGQFYSETTEQRLRKELAFAERARDRAVGESEYQRRCTEEMARSRAAVAGHLTRTKRRIARGVCPCCNRQFKDLARHMSNKHPSYEEATA